MSSMLKFFFELANTNPEAKFSYSITLGYDDALKVSAELDSYGDACSDLCKEARRELRSCINRECKSITISLKSRSVKKKP